MELDINLDILGEVIEEKNIIDMILEIRDIIDFLTLNNIVNNDYIKDDEFDLTLQLNNLIMENSDTLSYTDLRSKIIGYVTDTSYSFLNKLGIEFGPHDNFLSIPFYILLSLKNIIAGNTIKELNDAIEDAYSGEVFLDLINKYAKMDVCDNIINVDEKLIKIIYNYKIKLVNDLKENIITERLYTLISFDKEYLFTDLTNKIITNSITLDEININKVLFNMYKQETIKKLDRELIVLFYCVYGSKILEYINKLDLTLFICLEDNTFKIKELKNSLGILLSELGFKNE